MVGGAPKQDLSVQARLGCHIMDLAVPGLCHAGIIQGAVPGACPIHRVEGTRGHVYQDQPHCVPMETPVLPQSLNVTMWEWTKSTSLGARPAPGPDPRPATAALDWDVGRGARWPPSWCGVFSESSLTRLECFHPLGMWLHLLGARGLGVRAGAVPGDQLQEHPPSEWRVPGLSLGQS